MTKTDEKAQQGSDAPQASDKKPEATEPSVKAEPAAAETAKDEKVAPTAEAAPDSATAAKKDEKESSTGEAAAAVVTETKPEPAASSVESKPATGETPSGDNATAGEAADAKATTDAVAVAADGKEATADAAADGKKEEEDKTQNFRLNGAAKKRFRWLLDNGYERDEAAALAKDPIKVKELRDKVEAEGAKDASEVVGEFNFAEERKKLNLSRKRRLHWLIKNGHPKEEAMELVKSEDPPSKVAKITPPTGPIRIAVAAKDYPVGLLTNEQSNTVKAAILKQVVLQKDSDLKPRFENCIFVGGYLLVLCSDQPTVKFLQQTVPKLELWKEASLKVVSEKNLQAGKFTRLYCGEFEDSAKDTDKEILSFVESQNDGVSTEKWAIVARKPVAKTQTIELSFTVDPASAKTLQSLNNELNYKFAKVTLRKKHTRDNANNTNNARVGARSNNRNGNGLPNRNGNGLPNRNGNGFPNRNGNGFPNRNMGPRNTSSFVPVWDNNLPKRANYNNQVDSSSRRNNNFRSNSFRNGSNQSDNGSRNRGSGGGNQSSGGRPYNLVDSLYEQLKRTVNVSSANNSDQYGSRRGNGGGGGGNGYNQNGRNGGGYSSSGRSDLNLGNRNFFTSSRLGFF